VDTISILNRQAVGHGGDDRVVVLLPLQTMTRAEALVHAAWLVAIADASDAEFTAILDRVRNT